MEEQVEMQEIKDTRIQTEIFDSQLPSDLTFQQGPKNNQTNTSKLKHSQQSLGDDLQNYSVSGKSTFKPQNAVAQPEFMDSAAQTYPVKLYTDQRSSGFKAIWQAIVGYCLRQVCFDDGFFYILQPKNGLHVLYRHRLDHLRKVFVDVENHKIRFVFRNDNNKSVLNLAYKQPDEIINALQQELSKIGLKLLQS